jgi:hypothetical protein
MLPFGFYMPTALAGGASLCSSQAHSPFGEQTLSGALSGTLLGRGSLAQRAPLVDRVRGVRIGTPEECTNLETKAEPQQIVAQGLLSCLQYPVPYLSRLQRI